MPVKGRGLVKTKSGHLRYSSPSAIRHKYVHRDIIEKLLKETPYSIRMLVPYPYEVHHMDYDKENNKPCNLLLVSEAFHSKMTADRTRDDGGRFGRKFLPKWRKESLWLDGIVEDEGEEVPF